MRVRYIITFSYYFWYLSPSAFPLQFPKAPYIETPIQEYRSSQNLKLWQDFEP